MPFIQFCEKENRCWTPSESDHGVGTTTVRTLTDTLWYIDGHQSKFSERSCEVPEIFKKFAGSLSLSGMSIYICFRLSVMY